MAVNQNTERSSLPIFSVVRSVGFAHLIKWWRRKKEVCIRMEITGCEARLREGDDDDGVDAAGGLGGQTLGAVLSLVKVSLGTVCSFNPYKTSKLAT